MILRIVIVSKRKNKFIIMLGLALIGTQLRAGPQRFIKPPSNLERLPMEKITIFEPLSVNEFHATVYFYKFSRGKTFLDGDYKLIFGFTSCTTSPKLEVSATIDEVKYGDELYQTIVRLSAPTIITAPYFKITRSGDVIGNGVIYTEKPDEPREIELSENSSRPIRL